ncbi:TonB-dependent receptor plug domain-containing protein [Pseudomonas carassii]|uniref:TonB-dependent receptor plug domain-containing protein n=1 Tax=Pseudomonas carassii TaxID=3115855 RepID=A0ABU7HI02_9PSED|nr:TonB-dependent receptor plug domain-containing protein [Pseudomonas sp. 137P]MEE1890236.1 TonB-dependent receptor plug domain-containing protein [Pseudomonas sp. 137P]
MPSDTSRFPVLLCASLLLTAVPPALAETLPASREQSDQRHYFAIPAGPLGQSLARLAEHSGARLAYDSRLVDGYQAVRLEGHYSIAGALEALLAGSGLTVFDTGAGYLIRRDTAGDEQAVRLQPTNVNSVHNEDEQRFSNPFALTAEQIEKRPQANSNLTDLLRSHPVVQFSNSSQSGLNQGEIKPDSISIHGSRPYQGLFSLDGMRMNNDLDPVDAGNGVTLASGTSSEQGFYLDSRLIESLEVHDSNISARYSGFTGGVVEATSRSWRGGQGGRVYYRHSDADWNHTFSDSRLDFDSANNSVDRPARFQPKYQKSDYGAWAETQLAENLGVVVSASRRDSKIPMHDLGGQALLVEGTELVPIDSPARNRQQRRQSDNLSAKFSLYATPETTLHWTVLYSGYEEQMFQNTIADSGYRNSHDGLGSILKLEQLTDLGRLDLSASYRHMTDEREGDTDFRILVRDFTDWQDPRNYQYGGPGSLESYQDTVELSGQFAFDQLRTGVLGHQVTVGAGVNQVDAQFKRDQTYYSATFTGMDDEFNLQQVDAFFAGSSSTRYTSYHLFLEDAVEWGRVTVRPGVRLDRDDFVGRNNLAPRLAVSWDVQGNGDTVLKAGANRYYGSSMLTYALYGAQNGGLKHCYVERDCLALNDNGDGSWDATPDYEGLDGLKTPYSDELMVGLSQRWGNSLWSLQYVNRKHRDEVRSRPKYPDSRASDKRSVKQFTNDSKTDSDNVYLSVSMLEPLRWQGAEHVFGASLAWQRTRSDTALELGYTDIDLSMKLDPDKAWYNGKVISAKDLPATDFNAPWKLNLDWQATWQAQGLSLFNRLTFESSRDQVYKHDTDADGYYTLPDSGLRVRKYSSARIGSLWRWDTSLQWKPAFAGGLGFTAEVNNLFNTRNQSDTLNWRGDTYKVYQPGRQLWLGLSYDF